MTNSEILQLGQLVANLFAIIVAAGAANLAWRVGKKQNEINENLYNLNLIPSLEIIFNTREKRIEITNKGHTNISWCGAAIGEEFSFLQHPQIIPPQGRQSWKISKLVDSLDMTNNKIHRHKIKFYLMNQNKTKFIAESLFLFSTEDGKLRDIMVQTIGMEKLEW